jgi:Transcriptional Coactivator p15 (PC4)
MTDTQAAPRAQAAAANRWIADVPKNSREVLRVELTTYNGHDLVNLRVWYSAGDDDMRPGKAGVALRVEKLPHLRDAIDKAIAAARAEGSLS